LRCFFNQGACGCAGVRAVCGEEEVRRFVEKSAARAKRRTVGNLRLKRIKEQGPQVDKGTVQ